MSNYKLYIDSDLIDEAFQERLDREKNFEITRNWVVTNELTDADAYLVSEAMLDQSSSFKDRITIEPIICVNPHKQPSEFAIEDLDYDELTQILSDVEPIVDRIHHLEQNDIIEKGDPFLMGLAFIWSRGKALKPIINRRFEKGVWYPYFDTHIFDGSSGSETLSFLRNSGFLSTHVEEVAQACPKCASIMILLRDGCLDCGSVDIIEENLVHHFGCGYQASEARFVIQNEELLSELWCPKCHKPLRHYGQDYDKPTVMYRCQKCLHENSETKILGKCMSCHHTFQGEESPRREIKVYELTNLGTKALFEKEVNLFNLRQFLGQYIDLIPFDSFVMMAQKLRHIRTDLSLSVLKMSLQHHQGGDVDDEILSDARVMLDIGKNIARHIRKSDSVSIYRGNLYILFVEGENINESALMQKEGIQSLLQDTVVNRLVTSQMSVQDFLEGYIGKDRDVEERENIDFDENGPVPDDESDNPEDSSSRGGFGKALTGILGSTAGGAAAAGGSSQESEASPSTESPASSGTVTEPKAETTEEPADNTPTPSKFGKAFSDILGGGEKASTEDTPEPQEPAEPETRHEPSPSGGFGKAQGGLLGGDTEPATEETPKEPEAPRFEEPQPTPEAPTEPTEEKTDESEEEKKPTHDIYKQSLKDDGNDDDGHSI